MTKQAMPTKPIVLLHFYADPNPDRKDFTIACDERFTWQPPYEHEYKNYDRVLCVACRMIVVSAEQPKPESAAKARARAKVAK